MHVVVAIKALTVVYALASSVRARFHVGLAATIAITLLSVVLPILILTDHAGALGASAIEHPWVAPLLSAIVGAITTRIAFRAVDAEREPGRVPAFEGAAYALLGSTLLDLGMAVIAGFVLHLMARTSAS
ncbi:hypothetical protein [Sandaracinus amylolyticus]|uniref:hypothetical protein n=1 Tax=Sandaracinus amylolyticus TaxID=927083 RepID=UPI001F42F885|nr:hypothetical protein [Sandaracinus amylolyticus]UJR82218.1 Hypothetical protein I5071_42830 [Sandaracinus amylolyticus]